MTSQTGSDVIQNIESRLRTLLGCSSTIIPSLKSIGWTVWTPTPDRQIDTHTHRQTLFLYIIDVRTKVVKEENGTPNFEYEENRPSSSGPTVEKNARFGTFSEFVTTLTGPPKERRIRRLAWADSAVSLGKGVLSLIKFLKILIHFHFFHYCRA